MPYTATLQLRAKVQPSIKFKAKVQPNIKIKAQGLGEMISVRVSLSSTTFLNRGAVAFSPYSLFTFGTEGVWFDPSDAANLDWRRNLLTYTEQFDNAVWTKDSATISANSAVAPDGTTTADTITGVSGSFRAYQSVPVVSGATYTMSAYVKQGTSPTIGFGFVNVAGGPTFTFATASWSVIPGFTTTVQDVGSGWYRITVTAVSITTFAGPGWNVSGTTTAFIWGAQLELGTVATAYQRISDVNTEVLERFPNTTLYQDSIGTTAVTTPGQTVGLMLDKSKGLVLGSELITNGDFATDTGWTKGTGWTISGGAARFSAGADNADLVQSIGLPVIGKTYRITLSLSYTSGGELRVIYGGQFYGLPSVSGTYTMNFTATAASEVNIRFRSLTGASVYSLDNISVKEVPGNHATQATLAARPTYAIEPAGGRRNLLTYTEQFDNAIWNKVTNVTVTANTSSAPDGTITADKLIATSTSGLHRATQAVTVLTATSYASTLYAKAGEYTVVALREGAVTGAWAQFDLSAGTVRGSGNGGTGSITPAGNGWYRCSMVMTTAGTPYNTDIYVMNSSLNPAIDPGSQSWAGDNTSGILIWGAQLELGSTATPYQRVTTQYDVTEAGKPTMSYLYFDGVNDSMVTSTITPGTDKLQVFSGVRKLVDSAGYQVIVELSTDVGSAGNPGSFVLAPATGTHEFFSKGTAVISAVASGYAAPITNVVTGLGDISGDRTTIRMNSAQITQSTGDQGAGNYLAYPLYIGARAGASLFFNGRLYSLITRFGANLDTPSITSTESWVASKTGFYSPVITGVPTVGVS